MRLLFHSIESKRLITAYNNSSGREGRDLGLGSMLFTSHILRV